MAVTAKQLQELLNGAIKVDDYLTPGQFEFPAQVDEEEQEHLISLLAADDALELNGGRFGLVLAVDLDDQQLDSDSLELKFEQLAAVLYTDDGEGLSWFAPEEIRYQIDSWL